MRSTWISGLIIFILMGAGCGLTKKEIRPPEPPEEFFTPSLADPRYGKPLEYPREALNQPLERTSGPAGGLPPNGQRPGIGLNGLRPTGPTGAY